MIPSEIYPEAGTHSADDMSGFRYTVWYLSGLPHLALPDAAPPKETSKLFVPKASVSVRNGGLDNLALVCRVTQTSCHHESASLPFPYNTSAFF